MSRLLLAACAAALSAAASEPTPGRGAARRSAELAVEAGRRLAAGDPHGALLEATRALEFDPRSASAYARRAEAFNRLGRYDLGYADAVAALRREPRNLRALQNKAWSQAKRGDAGSALATIEDAASLSPGSAASALIGAYVRDRAGDRDGALRELRRAARLDRRLSDHASDYEGGGRIYDPFAEVPGTLRGRRGRSPAGAVWGMAAFALLAAAAWISGRGAAVVEGRAPRELRLLCSELRGQAPPPRAPDSERAPAHPVWRRARPRPRARPP